MKKNDLIKTLKKLSDYIDSCGHSDWCETKHELGVYCTCDKETAQDLCYKLIEDLEKEDISS